MNGKSFILMSFLFMAVGCQQIDILPEYDENITHIQPEKLQGIEYDIYTDVMASRNGKYSILDPSTRNNPDFTLTPFIVEGDTVMYVVQFDEGWKIYSGSYYSPKILFASETGRFDINDENMSPALRDIIQTTADRINNIPDDSQMVDTSWEGYVDSDNSLENLPVMCLNPGGGVSPMVSTPTPPGHWVRISVEEVDREEEVSSKLTTTQWGQQSPWNVYSKSVLNKEGKYVKAPAGCGPVAVSQYFYFMHYKIGVPQLAPATALATNDGTDYIFPSFGSSTLWDKMAKISNDMGTNYSALLIGETGRSLNARYALDGTEVDDEDILRVLTSRMKQEYEIHPYTYGSVMSYINNGYPLMTSAVTKKYSNGQPLEDRVGHTFIIDQYKRDVVTMVYTYGLVRDPMPPEEAKKYLLDLTDLEGNIIKYAYTKEEVVENMQNFGVSMNWGWSGLYNNVFCMGGTQWDAGGYSFTENFKLYLPK